MSSHAVSPMILARSSGPVIDPTGLQLKPCSWGEADFHSERHRWLTARVCLYCRPPDHFIAQVGQKTKLTSRYRRTGEQSFFLFHTHPFDNTWFYLLV